MEGSIVVPDGSPDGSSVPEGCGSVSEYRDRDSVNGFNFSVKWTEERRYEIFFPDLDVEDTRTHGTDPISDKVIVVGPDERLARSMFAYAKLEAEAVEDVYELYRRVMDYGVRMRTRANERV